MVNGKTQNIDYNTKILEVKNLKIFLFREGRNKLTIPVVDNLTLIFTKGEVLVYW